MTIETGAPTPFIRLTRAIDPNTVPLQVRQAWVLRLPSPPSPRTTPALQKVLKVLQREHGADALRHLKRIRKVDARSSGTEAPAAQQGSSTESRLEAVLAYRTKHGVLADEDSLLKWLEKYDPTLLGTDLKDESQNTMAEASKESRMLRLQEVPTTHIPTRDRVAEWNAVWPCVLRMTGPAPVSETNAKPSKSSKGGGDAGARGASTSLTSSSASIDFVDRAQDAQMWVEQLTSDSGKKPRFQWALNNLRTCIRLARQARERGDLPIAAYVSVGFDMSDVSSLDDRLPLSAHDTRQSTNHPLRHAVLNAIRAVADRRTTQKLSNVPSQAQQQASADEQSRTAQQGQTEAQGTFENGQDYLLNTLSLFTTHEPCIFCTMALVHSRVRQVFFLLPSPGSGGCCGNRLPEHYGGSVQGASDENGSRKDALEGGNGGGPFALHEQSGLNHHFEVWRWTGVVQDADLDAAMEELKLPGTNA